METIQLKTANAVPSEETMLTGITAPGGGGEGLGEAVLSHAVDIKEKGEGIYQMVDMLNSCIVVPSPSSLRVKPPVMDRVS